MNIEKQPTEVLITVMTYPLPSKGYQELVCTAGITKQSEWVRLYPINYRYLPEEKKFHKYQWIRVSLEPRGIAQDNRKESRKPDLNSIEIVGDPLSTKNRWEARRKWIDTLPHLTLDQYKERFAEDKTSLGIVRPTRVLDMTIEKQSSVWKPEWEAVLNQLRMFGDQPKKLAKIPYKFSYVFECEDSRKPHRAMCEDWELGVLFLKEVERLGSEEKAAESVRHKFLNDICADDKDTRFFMGTVFPYNAWVVLDVFYPPKEPSHPQQRPLF